METLRTVWGRMTARNPRPLLFFGLTAALLNLLAFGYSCIEGFPLGAMATLLSLLCVLWALTR